MYKCEEVLPYGNQGEKKRQQVENMFDSISGAYDKMNRMMTLSRDIEWRRKAIDSLKDFDPKKILDIATGTGDFAIESCNRLAPDSVMGVDIMMNCPLPSSAVFHPKKAASGRTGACGMDSSAAPASTVSSVVPSSVWKFTL